MRTLRTQLARMSAVGLAVLLGSALAAAQQAGSSSFPPGEQAPGTSSSIAGPTVVYQNTIRGGCVSGSTCITTDTTNGPDGGTITFPPVPADALPIFGYLYFQYLTDTDCTVDRTADFSLATINGTNINTLPFVEVSCRNAQACFSQLATHFYRVDMSSLFAECDLNVATFELRDFGMGNDIGHGPAPTSWVEGATLMVAYCSETSPQTDVILSENGQVYGVGPDSTPTITYSWSGFNATGDNASLVLGIGNGQNFTGAAAGDEEVHFSTTSTADTIIGTTGVDGLLDGDSICPPGPLGNGGMYDNTIVDVSALVNPGDSSATFTIVGQNDCLDSNAAFLCVESNTAPVNCVPDACIASTGACCDRAALSCTDFVAEDECLTPLEWHGSTLCDDVDPSCEPLVVVPVVSEWGLMVLTLLGLIVGTTMFAERRRRTAA